MATLPTTDSSAGDALFDRHSRAPAHLGLAHRVEAMREVATRWEVEAHDAVVRA